MLSHIIRFNYIILLFSLAPQLAHCAPTKKYDCADAHHPLIRSFDSITQLQKNVLLFDPKMNFVSFNITTISRLQTNDFISFDSNHIRKLILNDKRIEIIDNGAFNELFCVKYLLLQDNLIERLKNGSFGGLYSLEELYLNGNNLEDIPDGSFWNLKHVLKLDLSRNKIRTLSQGSFNYLPNLWELRLDYNQLQELPSGLFAYTNNLRNLHLRNNKISIPTAADFEHLVSLYVLDLKNNMISYLPDNIFKSLEKLTELNLAGNHLSRLNVENLPKLQRILLENNAWHCDDLQNILNQLEKHFTAVVIDTHLYATNVPAIEIGCFNSSTTYTPKIITTTGIPWWHVNTTTTIKPIPLPVSTTEVISNVDLPDHLEEADKNVIMLAINNLKTVVIVLIIIIIMFHVIDIMVRTNTCSKFRRRQPMLHQFQFSGYNDSSLPLLTR